MGYCDSVLRMPTSMPCLGDQLPRLRQPTSMTETLDLMSGVPGSTLIKPRLYWKIEIPLLCAIPLLYVLGIESYVGYQDPCLQGQDPSWKVIFHTWSTSFHAWISGPTYIGFYAWRSRIHTWRDIPYLESLIP